MRKTSLAITSDVYNIIKNSALKTAIKGNLYREGLRPINAETEDAVVSFLAGEDGQIQSGVLNLNIYVPDIYSNNSKVIDITRCLALEEKANTLIQSLSVSGSYRFELDNMIQTYKAEGIDQHFINCRIKFQLATF